MYVCYESNTTDDQEMRLFSAWDPMKSVETEKEAMEYVEANPRFRRYSYVWNKTEEGTTVEEKPMEETKPHSAGIYQCFHCGEYAVVWGGDFDFEDYGKDGDGVINHCTCTNCGAEIDYFVSNDKDDE